MHGSAVPGSRLGFRLDRLVRHPHTPAHRRRDPHPERWPVPCGCSSRASQGGSGQAASGPVRPSPRPPPPHPSEGQRGGLPFAGCSRSLPAAHRMFSQVFLVPWQPRAAWKWELFALLRKAGPRTLPGRLGSLRRGRPSPALRLGPCFLFAFPWHLAGWRALICRVGRGGFGGPGREVLGEEYSEGGPSSPSPAALLC